jgi:TonB family protein
MTWKASIVVAVLLITSASHGAVISPSQNCGVSGSTQPELLRTAAPQQTYYPVISILLNEQGNSLVDALIDQDGKMVDANILQSAGTERLDDASTAMLSAATFRPATFAGQPIACRWQIRIAWTLTGVQGSSALNIKQMGPDDYPFQARERREEGKTVLIVGIGESGEVASTLVIHSSGYPDLDAASVDYIRASTGMTAGKISGIAAKTIFAIAFKWSLSGKSSR